MKRGYSQRTITLSVAVFSVMTLAVVAALAYAAGRSAPVGSGALDRHPAGARSAESAITTFFDALERRDGPAMREVTSYRILRAPEREIGEGNAAPQGSLDSLRYTVALTPSTGYDYDAGSAYPVLVAESPRHRWYVAELGCC